MFAQKHLDTYTYIHTYIYTHIPIHTHTHTYIHTYLHRHIPTYMPIYIYKHTDTYVCIYTCRSHDLLSSETTMYPKYTLWIYTYIATSSYIFDDNVQRQIVYS